MFRPQFHPALISASVATCMLQPFSLGCGQAPLMDLWPLWSLRRRITLFLQDVPSAIRPRPRQSPPSAISVPILRPRRDLKLHLLLPYRTSVLICLVFTMFGCKYNLRCVRTFFRMRKQKAFVVGIGTMVIVNVHCIL
ncbi:hypothetical protein EmuJ_000351200 [Echinococcus multilocularis]|uniref:Uncharacterized protein n=1 Tax=Echinococcus multilocularis TaxID=6211 RepID=A0A068Y2W0_ECHMU|nr:hypothetical protein EmuJ_000351200 [Echinococcus multilocularis]